MTSIKSSNLFRYAAKPFTFAGNTKVFKWLAKNYEKDSAKFIAGVSIASVILKDGLGCYFYTTQSLNNEKIPENKRGFVAALDLANGVLMILAQLGMFFTISNNKVQNFLFDKTVGKYFSNAARRNTKELLKQQGTTPKNKKQFFDAFKNAEASSRAAFKIFLPLIGATIFAKRVIVPFIATPTASWVKTHLLKDDSGNAEQHSDTINSCILKETSLANVYKNIAKSYD